MVLRTLADSMETENLEKLRASLNEDVAGLLADNESYLTGR